MLPVVHGQAAYSERADEPPSAAGQGSSATFRGLACNKAALSPNPPGAFVLTPRALSAERTQWLTDVKASTPRYPFSDGMRASLAARRPVALVATET